MTLFSCIAARRSSGKASSTAIVFLPLPHAEALGYEDRFAKISEASHHQQIDCLR